jgi:uncharacterized protein YbcI
MAGTPEFELHQDVLDALKNELRAIHEASYGVGADSVSVHMLDDLLVVFLDGLHLQRSEEFMIDKGHDEAVLNVRSAYQRAIEPTFRAAVERIIGREVISFVSTTKLDPTYAVEIFRLAPPAD